MKPQHDYQDRAERFAPKTIDEIRDAARQMLRDGLGENSVADALQLDVNAARRLIGQCAGCGE